MNVRKFGFAAVVLIAQASSATAAFFTPASSTPVFENWTRGAANSVYAEWDVFTQANGATNSPDVGQSGVLGATVAQDSGTFGLITSGGNIYSFAGAMSFDVNVPGYGLGAGSNTRIVAQIATQGNPLLASSVKLIYTNGGSVVAAPSALYDRGLISDGTITRNEWLVVWDIPSFNPGSSFIEFASSASSMSLDKLAIDAYTQISDFAPVPANVPEPSTVALGGLTALVALAGRRGRRSA